MCRMLFAIGNINIDWLIQDFILMAANQNEKHEKNIDQEFKHGDGWGIAYRDNHQLKIFRSSKPIYEDPQVDQFRNLQTNFMMLHARKASQGKINIHNVHPFECQINGQHYVFCHNGTVRDELTYDLNFKPISVTDSERLFYYLLTNSQGQLTPVFLKSKLEKLKDFTAANFMLSNGNDTYLCNWFSECPNYYNLKIVKGSDFIIVSSEILRRYSKRNWQKLKNREIITIEASDLSLA